MRYHSHKDLPTKAERAAVMMLTLAELLIDGGERIVRLSADGKPHRAAAKAGRLAIAQMADAVAGELLSADADHGAPPIPPFTASLPRHSAVVLISDFLAPIADIAASLKSLMRLGITGHLLQVLDPAEETLPFSGRIRFVGLEREGATVIDRTEDARSQYVTKLAAHRDGLRALTAGAGWSFGVHHTDHSPQLAMAALHNAITGHRR
jgi:uncharacterized protein (DUF58 family)